MRPAPDAAEGAPATGPVPPELLAALTAACGSDGAAAAVRGAEAIARLSGAPRHDLLIVLGSGADGALAGWGKPVARAALSDVPGVLPPVAPGHADALSSYERPTPRGSVRVLVAHGRTHLYEGHGAVPVLALARAAAAAGVRAALLVNAHGCLRDWRLGDVMTVTDHLNLTGTSPFSGIVFHDVRQVWDPALAEVLAGVTERRGVYACLRGPEYQTLAETRLLAASGADAVGMSTVLEAIALHQLGVRAAGLSVVSDLSLAPEPTDPEEVVHLAARAHGTLARGADAVVAALAGDGVSA